MTRVVLAACLLAVLATSFAFAAEPETVVPAAPTSPSATPAQPEEPLALPGLIPEPANMCVQCSVQQERQCDAACVQQGHLGGACKFCSFECACFG